MKASILILSLIVGFSTETIAKPSPRSAGSRKQARVFSRGSSQVSTSATNTKEEETDEVKTKEVCEQLVYECMNKKTDEVVQGNEAYFNDYNDMLTDIYGGISNPAFKCIFNNEVKDLYSNYYYGKTGMEASERVDKIKKKSIEYYKFLKQNASDIASKRIAVNMVLPEVLSIAGISETPIDMKSQSLPDVSYKFTTLDSKSTFEQSKTYCTDPEQNKELEGCSKIKQDIADNWKTLAPNTIAKSCQDYETFLIDKKSKAQREAETFIMGLKLKIENNIKEYNAKIEADTKLN